MPDSAGSQCTQTATASNKSCLTGIGGTSEPANGTGLQQYTIDPNVAPYLAVFPAPTSAISGDTGTWTFNSEAVAKENLYTGRVRLHVLAERRHPRDGAQ